MFIESAEAIRPANPFMGESTINFAPKGASGPQFALVFYKHFTATRLSSELPWRHTPPFR